VPLSGGLKSPRLTLCCWDRSLTLAALFSQVGNLCYWDHSFNSFDISLYLFAELDRIGESYLVSYEGDQVYFDRPVVVIGGTIVADQVGFADCITTLEGGFCSDVDRGGVVVLQSIWIIGGDGPACVDAVGGEHEFGFYVDCWGADGSSTLIAEDDLTGDSVWSAKQTVCIGDAAVPEQPADHCARYGDDGLVSQIGFDRGDDLDFQTE